MANLAPIPGPGCERCEEGLILVVGRNKNWEETCPHCGPKPQPTPRTIIIHDPLGNAGKMVRNLADAIGLRDWTFRVDYAPLENPHHAAEVTRTYGRKCAVVTIHDVFLQASPEEQVQTIAHELIHCHLGVVQDHAALLEQSLPVETFSVWHPLFELQLEFAVDALADVITQHLANPLLGVGDE